MKQFVIATFLLALATSCGNRNRHFKVLIAKPNHRYTDIQSLDRGYSIGDTVPNMTTESDRMYQVIIDTVQ